MTTTSETGHVINVAQLDELVGFVTAYGTSYNPSKASIHLTALQTLSVNAKKALDDVKAANPDYSNAVAAREAAFEPLSKLTTRILNALKTSDASEQVIDNAKTIIRKIQGVRATPKKTEEEKQTLTAEGKETKEVSSSQMSYNNRLDSFDKLIKLLNSLSNVYTPNETDLQIATLTTLFSDLTTQNATVIATNIPLSNSRLSRDEILYKDTTGLYDIANAVKTYIKSVFGATSPQYKQISSLKFTKPR